MCHCMGPLVSTHVAESHQHRYQCASCGRRVRHPIDCCARPNFQSLAEPGIFIQIREYLKKGWHSLWKSSTLPPVVEESKSVESPSPATVIELCTVAEKTEEVEEEEALIGAGTEK